jgi:hypothetical protein
MATRSHTMYFYSPCAGPVRNGASDAKPALFPSAVDPDMSFEDLQGMAADIIDWGNHRWASDHGALSDHQRLIDFVNITMRRLSHMY